jgi:2'-5' RNA ligase
MAPGTGLADKAAPFVLTLEMDGEAFARLDALRKLHFPPDRNLVPAHVTLFHQLPGDRAREIKAMLREAVTGLPIIDVQATEVKFLGQGVGISLRSPQLLALREALGAEWWPWLNEQDRAGYRPHVTLQNKVSAAEARRTHQSVAATFRPFVIRGLGLHLWRYLGGPWEDVQLFPLSLMVEKGSRPPGEVRLVFRRGRQHKRSRGSRCCPGSRSQRSRCA